MDDESASRNVAATPSGTKADQSEMCFTANGTEDVKLSQPLNRGQNASSASVDSIGRPLTQSQSERSVDGSSGDVPQEARGVRPDSNAADLGSLEDIVRDSPFLDLNSPMTAYEWFKIVLLFPWALFKFVVAVIGLIFVWAVTRITSTMSQLLVIGVKPNEAAAPWRFKLIRPWLRFWTGILLRLGFGFWNAKCTGWENFREAERARAICIFNHQSYVDAIVMTHFFALSGVAKASVAKIPFIGPIAVALQFLFVQRRGSADKSNKHTQLAGRTSDRIAARSADDRFPMLMIAPEATTKHGNVLLKFSTGAFVPGRPILPILLKYRARHFDVGWGITASNLWHLWRLISQFVNFLEVQILPVYYPNDDEAHNPALFAANVRQLMGHELGAKLSTQGFEHNVALKKNHVHMNFTGTNIIMQAK